MSPASKQQPRHTERPDGTGFHSLRFRAGAPVDIIDLSASGALVETERHLGPGMTVEMLLTRSDASEQVRARVAHARVCRLAPGRPARYRIGLSFTEAPVRLAGAARVSATQNGGAPAGLERRYPDGRADRREMRPHWPRPIGDNGLVHNLEESAS